VGRWEFALRVNVIRALAVAIVLGEQAPLSHETVAELLGVEAGRSSRL
jgi:hypothetical protein